jgi:hypothetical protein
MFEVTFNVVRYGSNVEATWQWDMDKVPDKDDYIIHPDDPARYSINYRSWRGPNQVTLEISDYT